MTFFWSFQAFTYLKTRSPEANVLVPGVDTSAERRVEQVPIIATLPDAGQPGAWAENDKSARRVQTEGVLIHDLLVTFMGAVNEDI
jgi:hypothetical protein